jgi:hypothetical protein
VAVLCGTVLTPLLLPHLPGRMFALKGALVGLALSLSCLSLPAVSQSAGWTGGSALVLLMSTVSAFFAMNFTGSTPFTAPSGVRLEMRRSLPAMAVALVGSIGLLLVSAVLP